MHCKTTKKPAKPVKSAKKKPATPKPKAKKKPATKKPATKSKFGGYYSTKKSDNKKKKAPRKKSKSSSSSDCIVCMDKKAVKTLNPYGCPHKGKMCKSCTSEVARTSNMCPTCRRGPGPPPPTRRLLHPLAEISQDGSVQPNMEMILNRLISLNYMNGRSIDAYIEAFRRSTVPPDQSNAIISGLRVIRQNEFPEDFGGQVTINNRSLLERDQNGNITPIVGNVLMAMETLNARNVYDLIRSIYALDVLDEAGLNIFAESIAEYDWDRYLSGH